jgi:hypothetical protein
MNYTRSIFERVTSDLIDPRYSPTREFLAYTTYAFISLLCHKKEKEPLLRNKSTCSRHDIVTRTKLTSRYGENENLRGAFLFTWYTRCNLNSHGGNYNTT